MSRMNTKLDAPQAEVDALKHLQAETPVNRNMGRDAVNCPGQWKKNF